MALRQTLPRAQWNPFHFWFLNKQNKEKRLILNDFPDDALMWRDTSNAKPLRYITFNGKYLVVKNV